MPAWAGRALRPQALAGGPVEFPWTLALAAVVALVLTIDLLVPIRIGAGGLVVLPVLAASWVLGPRGLALVVAVAVGIELVALVLDQVGPLVGVGRVVTVTVVAAVGRAAATSFAEVRRARHREVAVLLRSSHLMGRPLDQHGVAAEAVRVAAGALVPAGQGGIRQAVLIRFTGEVGTVLAFQDRRGVSTRPNFRLDLAELTPEASDALATGRTTVVRTADLDLGLRAAAVQVEAVVWAMARVQVAGEPFGLLCAGSSDVHAFSRDDLRLLDGIARVTGLAIGAAVQHAEVAELKQRLEQSVELALDVGRSLKPAEVVDSIVLRVTESVGANHATLVRVDGDRLVIESTYRADVATRVVPVRRSFPAELVEGVPELARALATGQAVVGGPFQARSGADVLVLALPGGAHTLTLPFMVTGRTVCLLALSRERPFGDADVDQLDPMVDVALLALRNAHLHATTARAERAASRYSGRLEHAIKAAEDIGSTEELGDVVQRVLRRAVAAVRAERGSISRIEGNALVMEHEDRPPGAVPKPLVRRDLSRSRLAAAAIVTRRPVRTTLGDGPDGTECPAGVRHAIQCPLLVEREVVGILGLARNRDEPFTDEDLQVLQPFATLAALLVRNARLLDEARQAGQAKSEFLHLAAHELRTPLAVIRGYLSLLEDGTYPVPDRTRAEAVDTLVSKAQELESLVESLVVAARLDGGTLPRSDGEMDVGQAVREAVGRILPRARLEEARIDLRIPELGVVARADRGHVARILDNLLNNAVTHSPQPASVSIELRQCDPVEVAVRDQGHGIPADQHERVFDRFHRVDTGGSRALPGLGLGLSLSRELARLNGGALLLEASAPGRGSVFVLRLPTASSSSAV
ncbi:MAG TPA: GAF domain-containing protein [Candidatus Dormibacteraeota bacterium]